MSSRRFLRLVVLPLQGLFFDFRMLLHKSSFQLGMFRFHHGGRLPSGCFRFDLYSENSFVPLHSCCLTFGPGNSKCVTMDLWSLPRSIMSSASESLQSFMLLLSMRMWYNCLSFARSVRYAACFSSLFFVHRVELGEVLDQYACSTYLVCTFRSNARSQFSVEVSCDDCRMCSHFRRSVGM